MGHPGALSEQLSKLHDSQTLSAQFYCHMLMQILITDEMLSKYCPAHFRRKSKPATGAGFGGEGPRKPSSPPYSSPPPPRLLPPASLSSSSISPPTSRLVRDRPSQTLRQSLLRVNPTSSAPPPPSWTRPAPALRGSDSRPTTDLRDAAGRRTGAARTRPTARPTLVQHV